jgi:serine/threonine protein phosphatase 1
MSDARLPHIPDDWQVWAFSDVHGVTSGLVAALHRAGLIDDTQHWVAPPRTALVGCGDYLDRGGDVAGIVTFLQRLAAEAAARGGAVHLARGNHEALPLMIRGGAHEWLGTWLDYGGDATLRSFGCDVPVVDGADGAQAAAHAARITSALDARAPGLFDWLTRLPEAVRWRDVLLVHAGLAPGFGPSDLGTATDQHVWIRAGFFERPWHDEAFAAYREAGIERVVFGHTPHPGGPVSFHGGRSLDIDTNAVGNPDLPADSRRDLTLLGPLDDGSLERAELIRVDTSAAAEGTRT